MNMLICPHPFVQTYLGWDTVPQGTGKQPTEAEMHMGLGFHSSP